MSSSRYVVITPARDEEEHLGDTIRGMASQTVRPARWIIVNDGSTDRTREIAESAAREHDWIRVLNRADRGFRKAGGGVVAAFNEGLELLDLEDWDFIVKFDADLSIQPDYFERCFERFRQDPKLGIGGGVIHHHVGNRMILEKHPKFHVRGATKIYRRACWEDISPLFVAPGWDTADEVKANMLGWSTYSFHELVMVQNRMTGMANGRWGNSTKNGRACYLIGYHPLFLLLRSAVWLKRWPPFVQSLGLAWGYFRCYFKGEKRVDDPDLLRYMRDQQFRRLLGRPSIWK